MTSSIPRSVLREMAGSSASPDLSPGTEGILLTGATGFLGTHLLSILPRDEPIHCLVRARHSEDAIARLEASARLYRLGWNPQGILPVCGGLSDFPMPDVRAVWHLAAALDLQASAQRLWAANVQPLAHLGRHPGLVLASTLSVFVSTSRHEGTFMEEDSLSEDMDVYGGYAQTKTAAEYAAPAAAVVRFGLLTGSTETGLFPPRTFFPMLVEELRKLGCFTRPVDPDTAVDVTPVDIAARAFAAVAGHGGTFHVANHRGLTLPALLSFLTDRGGLVEVSNDEFAARIARLPMLAKTLLRNAFFRDCCKSDRVGAGGCMPGHFCYDLFQRTRCRFDMRRTEGVFPQVPDGGFATLLPRYFP